MALQTSVEELQARVAGDRLLVDCLPRSYEAEQQRDVVQGVCAAADVYWLSELVDWSDGTLWGDAWSKLRGCSSRADWEVACRAISGGLRMRGAKLVSVGGDEWAPGEGLLGDGSSSGAEESGCEVLASNSKRMLWGGWDPCNLARGELTLRCEDVGVLPAETSADDVLAVYSDASVDPDGKTPLKGVRGQPVHGVGVVGAQRMCGWWVGWRAPRSLRGAGCLTRAGWMESPVRCSPFGLRRWGCWMP